MLVEEKYVEEVLRGGEEEFRTLVDRAQELEEFARGFGRRRKSRVPKPPPPDASARALNRIRALEAADLPEVTAFRHAFLASGLLTPERMREWIRRKARQETAYWSQRGSHGDWPLWFLPPGEKHADAVLVPDRGLFFQLAQAVQKLSQGPYYWPASQAVGFVLTGHEPEPPLMKARVAYSATPPFAPQRIVLDLDPRVHPQDVARWFAKHRTTSFGNPYHRPKTVGEKAAELAVFVAQVNDGRTWAEALAEWHRHHRKWRFDHRSDPVRAFAHHARISFKSVTGEKLIWKGARARTSEEEPLPPPDARLREAEPSWLRDAAAELAGQGIHIRLPKAGHGARTRSRRRSPHLGEP